MECLLFHLQVDFNSIAKAAAKWYLIIRALGKVDRRH